jgi:hypothetical protein
MINVEGIGHRADGGDGRARDAAIVPEQPDAMVRLAAVG